MNPAFPLPPREPGNGAATDAAPAATDFSRTPRDSALRAREGEPTCKFSDLVDENAAPPAPLSSSNLNHNAVSTTETAPAENAPAPVDEPAAAEQISPDIAGPHALGAAQASVSPAPANGSSSVPSLNAGVGPGIVSEGRPANGLNTTGLEAGRSEVASSVLLRTPRPAHFAPAAREAAPAAVATATAASTPAPTSTETSSSTPVTNVPARAPISNAVPNTPATPTTLALQPSTAEPAAAPATTPVTTMIATPAGAASVATELAATSTTPTRPTAVRPGTEKLSARAGSTEAATSAAGQKQSLAADPQLVNPSHEFLGTGSALQGATMKFAPQFAPKPLAPAPEASAHAQGQQGGAQEFSFAWKGWTNGGGERAATAAQFSRFSEHVTPAAVPGSAAASQVARHAAPAPVAAPAPAYPINEAALLAPINAAIERIITRGPEQLAVVVRFEQGGSLALQLTMREGSIAAHMQTDVPGLEAALRNSWSSFAQDWSHRGVKLAAPSFGAGVNANAGDGRDSSSHGQRSPQQEQPLFAGGDAPSFATLSGRRTFHNTLASAADPADRPAASKSIRARIAQRRGLSTWA